MTICIVSSCGGHLTEVRALLPAYQDYRHYYVLNDRALLPEDMIGRTHFITHSERDWKFLVNLWEAWRILRAERPRIILSTGAGPAVPFALVGRLLGCRIVFVESVTRITAPSMTGKLMHRLAHDFFYQWPQLARFFPRGQLGGPLL
ncbi:PssD/Cps14F family polysaccharide biosynthesis glycosyltransferase [Polymorphobacter sp.]|uniref:PssD/Cps14F family polysaccharide biosynthesis glycosyltransferase n=1 Tax=Polymorphobacter sp. TaxID=1909290 RepID=UPI003F726CA0